MKILARAITLLLAGGLLALAPNVVAQQSKPAQQAKPESAFKPNPRLNDQEKRGEYLFLQRCALCHLAKYSKSVSTAALPPVWWSLEGLFKDAKPDKEKVVHEFILKGTQRVPGFQYTLEPKEIDDLIVYLETL